MCIVNPHLVEIIAGTRLNIFERVTWFGIIPSSYP